MDPNLDGNALKKIRGPDYASSKLFFRCIYPKPIAGCCGFVGTLSEVTVHLARHMKIHIYTCNLCGKEIYDQTEIYTHTTAGNRFCGAGPEHMIAYIPSRHSCVDAWRGKNVFIVMVEKEEYEEYKEAQERMARAQSTSRRVPGTPGYDDDLLPPIQEDPPMRPFSRAMSRGPPSEGSYRRPQSRAPSRVDMSSGARSDQMGYGEPPAHGSYHRSQSRAPSRVNMSSDQMGYGGRNWNAGNSYSQQNQSNFSFRRDTSRTGGNTEPMGSRMNYNRPPPQVSTPYRPNYFTGQMRSPANSNYQPRPAPIFQSRSKSSHYNRSPKETERQCTTSAANRSRSRGASGWGRSPSPDLIDVTPNRSEPASSEADRNSHRSRASSSVREENDDSAGTHSLAIQKPRDMTRHRRSSVNYRSPAPPRDLSCSAKDRQDIARNQQKFQVEAKGTTRVLPNRNRMAALMDPVPTPARSEIQRQREAQRQERLAQLRGNQGSESSGPSESGPPTKKARE
ncbi:hypothetical protein B9Z55_002314 [Caenorhabditis nigoni]|uniref:Uncharacterized protein n=1 Tax=Caenorhabditis nigoni TaxID=1611254 RepID=A0A2G5VJS1_9PELO|nr:hypothetical protein B9Z55_002314 [Caenorhabditis nigoni]